MTLPASKLNKSDTKKSSDDTENHGEINGLAYRENSKKRPPDNDLISQPPSKRRNEIQDSISKRKHEDNNITPTKRRKIDESTKETFFQSITEKSQNSCSFRVASYNISKWLKYNVSQSIDKETFVNIVNDLLNSHADLICLQEVPESIWKKLNKEIKNKWKNCAYVTTDNECLNVILYNNKFEKVDVETKSIKNLCNEAINKCCNNVDDSIKELLDTLSDISSCITCTLKIITRSSHASLLIVGNSHISSNNGKNDISCLQTSSLFWYLHRKLNEVISNNSCIYSPMWLWCGDFEFNCKTLSSLCKVGYLDDEAINEMASSNLFQKCCHAFQHPINTEGIFWTQESDEEARYMWIDNKLRPDKLDKDASTKKSNDGNLADQANRKNSCIKNTDITNNNASVTSTNNNNYDIDMEHLWPLICMLSFPI